MPVNSNSPSSMLSFVSGLSPANTLILNVV